MSLTRPIVTRVGLVSPGSRFMTIYTGVPVDRTRTPNPGTERSPCTNSLAGSGRKARTFASVKTTGAHFDFGISDPLVGSLGNATGNGRG